MEALLSLMDILDIILINDNDTHMNIYRHLMVLSCTIVAKMIAFLKQNLEQYFFFFLDTFTFELGRNSLVLFHGRCA